MLQVTICLRAQVDNTTRPHGQGIKIATPPQRIKEDLIILSNVEDEYLTLATRRRDL